MTSALTVKSLQDPLADESSLSGLGGVLKDYIAGRRWFRAKTKTIRSVSVDDAVQLPGTSAYVLILTVSYTAGEADNYILPVLVESSTTAENERGLIVGLASDDGASGVLLDALDDKTFRDVLLEAIVCETKVHGKRGVFEAQRTGALDRKCGENTAIPSFVSRAEQSNTSIIYRERYILKLFRKLEAGVNPDLEIGAFLTKRGFKNTPAALGSIEYKAGSESYAAAILQQFVPNQGDAWKFTLESLAAFYDNVDKSGVQPPPLPNRHPLELMNVEVAADLRPVFSGYLEAAALLGRRTAEMHAALSDESAGPDFVPEAFGEGQRRQLEHDLTTQAEIAFDLLRQKESTFTGDTATAVRALIAREAEVKARLAELHRRPIKTTQIRHHGDYHLGQVLYTGDDFMIIDFEGEPARPLAARRAKALALRDVAGMLRSFQYAAFAALFERAREQKAWAIVWNAYVGAAYLRAYFETAGAGSFVPRDPAERRTLVDAFLLQKALYELAYELNNRPDWLQIPLEGILSLVEEG